MDNYIARANIPLLMEEEFGNKIFKLVEEKGATIETVKNLIAEVETDFDASMVLEPISRQIEEVFTPANPPYCVSPTFQALNHPDYRVLSDGFIAVGAEANTGKTTLMTALAIDLLSNNPDMCALVYSLDDGGNMTKKRIVSQLLGRNMLQSHTVPSTEITKEHEMILERIYVKDTIRLQNIEAEAQRIKKDTGCPVIYIGIDYLQIIPVSESRGSREGFNEVVKRLKEIQKRLATQGCILLLLSQLNRATSGDSPYSMSRYRETSEIENQADVGLLMFMMNSDPNIEDDRERKVWIVKNKKGMRGRWWNTRLVRGHRFSEWKCYDPNDDQSNDREYKSRKSAYDSLGKEPTNMRCK